MSLGIGRNTVTLLAASVVQKATAFVYFALIARWAGVEDTGKYFFALSWALLFSVVTDAGLTPVLIRESAKDHEAGRRYLNQVFTLKIPLIILAAVLVIGGVHLLGYPPVTRQMVYLSAIVLALDAVSLTFYGFLRGHYLLKYEALGLIVSQFVILAFGVWALRTGQPVQYLIVALILGSFYNALQAIYFTRRRIGILPKLVWDAPFAKTLLKTAFPFALAGAFVKIYSSVDAVLLSKLVGDTATGLYSVPYKMTFAFQFIPMGFTAALYPAMSKYWAVDKEQLGRVLYKGMKYLALLAFPLVVGAIVLARELIFAIYGPAYLPAVLGLQVLVVTLISVFLGFPLGSILNATDRQMVQTKLMGLATLVSVVLNVALIPRIGFMGAVIASLVSHFVLFGGGIVAVNRFLSWPKREFVADLARIMTAAAVMGALVAALKGGLGIAPSVFLGAAVYAAAIFTVRAVTAAEAKDLLVSVFGRKKPAGPAAP